MGGHFARKWAVRLRSRHPQHDLPLGHSFLRRKKVALGGTEAKKSSTFAVKARRLRARQCAAGANMQPAPRPARLPASPPPTPAPAVGRSPSDVPQEVPAAWAASPPAPA